MTNSDADFVVRVLEVTDNGGLYGSGCDTVDGTGHFQALLRRNSETCKSRRIRFKVCKLQTYKPLPYEFWRSEFRGCKFYIRKSKKRKL